MEDNNEYYNQVENIFDTFFDKFNNGNLEQTLQKSKQATKEYINRIDMQESLNEASNNSSIMQAFKQFCDDIDLNEDLDDDQIDINTLQKIRDTIVDQLSIDGVSYRHISVMPQYNCIKCVFLANPDNDYSDKLEAIDRAIDEFGINYIMSENDIYNTVRTKLHVIMIYPRNKSHYETHAKNVNLDDYDSFKESLNEEV